MIGHNAPLLMSFLEQNAHASLSSLLLQCCQTTQHAVWGLRGFQVEGACLNFTSISITDVAADPSAQMLSAPIC